MTSSTAEGMDAFGGTGSNNVSHDVMDSSTAQGMDDKDSMIFADVINDANGAKFSGSFRRVTPPVLRIIAKNVRGLGTEDRMEELLFETQLMNENWDIITLSETWREDGFEMWSTDEGHLFANAGCEEKRRGTGF